MPERIIEELEKKLEDLLGSELPAHPAQNINAALQVAELLESRGFSFQLKDLCPSSMNETKWCATFIKNGTEFAAEDAQTAVAVCSAATAALDKN